MTAKKLLSFVQLTASLCYW